MLPDPSPMTAGGVPRARESRFARAAHLVSAGAILVIFSAALVLLYRELRHYRYADVRASLQAISWGRIALATCLTALNYVVMVGYDWLAIHYLGMRLSLARTALASFIGSATSHNLGAVLGATPVRYRLYSTWGLSAAQIFPLLAILALTFWVGVAAIAGVVFLVHPVRLPEAFHLPFEDVRPLGIILLATVVMYLLLAGLWRRPLHWRTYQVELLPLRVSLAQVLIASADLMVAAAVLYVLLPATTGVSYLGVLGVYLFSVVGAMLTHVPGGIGIFELSVLVLIAPPDPHEVLASLVIFRLIYYVVPLGAAMALLLSTELRYNRQGLARAGNVIGRWSPWIVSRVVAFLVFAAGAVLLLSGALPAGMQHSRWARHLLPLSVVELSHFLSSLVGVMLLLLSRAILRRVETAYWLTCGLLFFGAVFALLRGLDYVDALILLGLLVLLLPLRHHFHHYGSWLRQPLTLDWWMATILVLGCSAWLWFFAYKHVEYSEQLWWRFAISADAPRSLRAMVGAVSLLLLLGVGKLMGRKRHSAPKCTHPRAGHARPQSPENRAQ